MMEQLTEKQWGEKIGKLYSLLQNCKLCGHNCGINRLKAEKGKCRVTSKIKISSYFLHYGEEKPISGINGSGTIFFSNCNLSCQFCQNYEISQLGKGYYIQVEDLTNIMLYLQNQKAHNINLVSPTHFLPLIVKAIYLAKINGLKLPIVYNTGGYDNPEVIEILNGIIDIYMPDMKYSENETAQTYSSAKNYPMINQASIKVMYRQVGGLKIKNGIAISGLLVRHLVMPGFTQESKRIIDFLSTLGTDIYLNIMDQYHPTFKAKELPKINRKITINEYYEVLNYAKEKGFIIKA